MIKEGDLVKNFWGNGGKIIGIEDDVVYILMDDPSAVIDGDGETGIEITLLSDIGDI